MAGHSFEQDEDDATLHSAPLDDGSFLAERYRIERKLDGGAFATVYLAIDTRRGELPVAIKVLRAGRAGAELRARFTREGAVLAALDHPGVVRVLDAGEIESMQLYLVLERLEGETLATRLARVGKLPVPEMLRLVAFAADAIDAVHELSIVHRDLSPQNVFLPSKGTFPVKLIDFGFSHAAADQRLTATGTAIGTPLYMAPEMIVSVKTGGAPADIYGLSVCAYEMLAGTSPYDVTDRGQLLGAVLHGRSTPLVVRRPDLPAAISVAIARGMAPRPEERFGTASELAAALYMGAMISPPIDLPARVRRRLSREPAPPPAPPGPSRLTPSYLAPPDTRTPVPPLKAVRVAAAARTRWGLIGAIVLVLVVLVVAVVGVGIYAATRGADVVAVPIGN